MLNFKFSRVAMAAVMVLLALQVTGCTVIAVVDAVASTAVGVTKVAVKGTTAVVGAVIPGGDDDEKKED